MASKNGVQLNSDPVSLCAFDCTTDINDVSINQLTWSSLTEKTIQKASNGLYFLFQLKRAAKLSPGELAVAYNLDNWEGTYSYIRIQRS